MKMWENEKIRGTNNLDDSKCDTHQHDVLNNWVPNSHKNKIIFMWVLAESSLSEKFGMLEI